MMEFRNNCRNSIRCDGCPVELLEQPTDRTRAAFLVTGILHDIEMEGSSRSDFAARGSDELVGRTLAVIDELDYPLHLVGVAVGAVALTLNEQCNIAHKVEDLERYN